MALLTSISDAAWPTSGTPTAGNTGFSSLTSSGTLTFTTDEEGEKIVTTTATNASIVVRIDPTSAVFASGETRYQVELVVYAELTGESGDPTIGSPANFFVDLNGAGGRGTMALSPANNTSNTGFFASFGAFNGASVGNQLNGVSIEPFPVGRKMTVIVFGDRTAGIAGVCINGVRWGTWTAGTASTAWGTDFSIALSATEGVRWRVYASTDRPARSWTGTTNTFSPASYYDLYKQDNDELVMCWPHVATDGLHGSLWTYTGTGTVASLTSSGVNPGRNKLTGGSGGIVAVSAMDVGQLQWNEYGDCAFVTTFYVPANSWAITFQDSTNSSTVAKFTASADGTFKDKNNTTLTASDSAAISISTAIRYGLVVNFTRGSSNASFTVIDLTNAPTSRIVWSNTFSIGSSVTSLGKIVLTVGQTVEAERVDICKWWTNGICDSLVSAFANLVTPSLACCANNVANAFPQRDSIAVPGIAYGLEDFGWPKDSWFITTARSGYRRSQWATNARDYMTHTHAMKIVTLDGAQFNDINNGTTATGMMSYVEDDVAFCATNRNKIILSPTFKRAFALAGSVSTTEYVIQQQYSDLLEQYWLENNTNPRIGWADARRLHPQPMTTTDGAHPTSLALYASIAVAGTLELGRSSTGTSRRPIYIGQFDAGTTISSAFRSTGSVDLSANGLYIEVYRNGVDTNDSATIGTTTASTMPYSYTLNDDFEKGNTGEFILRNSADEIVARQWFSVLTSPSTGSSISILSDALDVVSQLNDTDEPRAIYKGRIYTVDYTFPDYAGDVTDGETLTLRVMPLDSYEDVDASSTLALIQTTASATLSGTTLTATFTLTAEQTGALPAGAKGDGATDYRLQVLPAGNKYLLTDRVVEVRRAMGTPA